MIGERRKIVLVNFVQQTAVADFQQASRLFPVPRCMLERGEYGLDFPLCTNRAQGRERRLVLAVRVWTRFGSRGRCWPLRIVFFHLWCCFNRKLFHHDITFRRIISPLKLLQSKLNGFNLVALDANGK